jgi:hypothetical protein
LKFILHSYSRKDIVEILKTDSQVKSFLINRNNFEANFNNTRDLAGGINDMEFYIMAGDTLINKYIADIDYYINKKTLFGTIPNMFYAQPK